MSLKLNTDQNPITLPTASPTSEGLMSAADKTKLDALSPGGAVFVVAPLIGDGSVGNPIDASAFLAKTGGTLSGALLFAPDNTYDIGANGLTRPRNIYAAGQVSSDLGFVSPSGDNSAYVVGIDAAPAFGTTLAIGAQLATLINIGRRDHDVMIQPSFFGAARLGFFSFGPVVRQTGVAVTAAGIHAALVAYGLIGA